nr:MotE family protein [uncultured Bacillus sp.]
MKDKWQEELEEEKSYGKLQWFFVVIVIPSLFAVAVALIVATVAGVNVMDKAKEYSEKIPFLSSDEQEKEQKNKDNEAKNIKLNAELKVRGETIAELQEEVNSKNEEIEGLELEKKQLQREIEDLGEKQSEHNREFKEIVKTYEAMSAKKAAPIIAQMKDEKALEILSNLKSDTLAAIMEQMNAVDAAKYTSLLTQNSNIN